MKNHKRALIIFALLLFCFVALTAQKNTGYLSLSLPDRGLGFRYERNFITEPQTNSLSGYISLTRGNYVYWYEGRLKHLKIGSGLSYNVRTPGSNYINLFCVGLNYNFYSKDVWIHPQIAFPVSFDLGTGIRIKRVNVLMTYDLLKKDASINLGYNF
jgi:hypothetical protein